MYPVNNFMMQQPYQNPYNNPYNSCASAAQQSLTRVTGLDGAKAYQMGANGTVALFDSNNDYMYIKSTDGAGFPTIRTFKFEEVTNATNEKNDQFITKNEFETFKQEVTDYVQQFIQQQSSSKPKFKADSGTDQVRE